MAISKELKEYVTKKFNDRLASLDAEIVKRTNEINNAKAEESTDIISDLNSQLQRLLADAKGRGVKLNICYYQPLAFIYERETAATLLSKTGDSALKRLLKDQEVVKKQKAEVIVKLSVLKDFSAINEILDSYAIGF